ncbi:hypothetical protein scyTo_0009388, partial [Scyliorhinus torazame]|nr:hypothetical protein [Scyliorhinus torazame]
TEDQLPSGFPNIDMGPQLKVVERTRTATMLCAASGNPDPEITWFKDFLPVDPSSSTRIKQLRSGALQIENSEETDQGKYECVASNNAGVRYSPPANLYVRVRRVPPRFSISPPLSQEIVPGGSVNITCVAVGSPMPYVKWMLGTEDLTPEDDMPVGRNVLELNSIRESANYTCVAMSSLGVIETVSQIIVKALPKPPGTPIVVETTATSVTLTWDSGNPDHINYYIIEYRPKNTDVLYQTIDGIQTLRYSIGGLSPYSDYEFRISAVNSIGQGQPSETVETRTGEQVPSSSPRSVQARMLSATTMLIQWEEPEEPNGQIRGYRVYYTMEPQQPVSNWQKHNLDDSLLTTVANLIPQTTYSVKVLAFTSVGDGPLSAEIQVKTQQGVPGQPINFNATPKSETSIELLWRAPREEKIISYELYYRDEELGKEEVITFQPSTSYSVTGLRPNTLYYFRLAGRSEHGLGVFTSQISARTLQAKPSSPPQNVKCTSPSSTSILVSWWPPPPESQNGDLAKYSIRYQTVQGEDKQLHEVNDIPPTTTQMRLESLAKWTEYQVSVVAHTMVGPGPESAPIFVRTDEDVPSAPPRKVEVEALNSTALKVIWRSPVPNKQHGQIRGYQVHYVEVVDGEARGQPLIKDIMLADAQWETDDTAEYEMIISGLQPETMYSITVAAYTTKGDGVRSKSKLVVTKGSVPDRPTLSARLTQENTAVIQWQPPSATFGQLLGYQLHFGRTDVQPLTTLEFSDHEYQYVAHSMHKGATYVFRLAARNRAGLGDEDTTQLTLPEDVPRGYPQILDLANITTSSVQFGWLPPALAERNGNITMYTVSCVQAGAQSNPIEVSTRSSQTSLILNNLKPDTRYDIKIRAQTSKGPGPYSHAVQYRTIPLDQAVFPKNFRVKLVMKTSVLLSWEIPEHYNSPIPYKDLTLRRRRSLRPRRQLGHSKPYIAARFDVLPRDFILGDQRFYGGFENRPLEQGNKYVFFILGLLDIPEAKMFAASPYSDPILSADPDPQPIIDGEEGLIWVVGPVLAVVFIICIVIAILLYKKKRKESDPRTKCLLNNAEVPSHHPTDPVEMRRINFQTPGMMSHPPIPIAELAEHTEHLKANDNLKFSQEYESIDPGQQFTWEHSNMEVNKPKNRYANVIAYDHSRVILAPIEGIAGSDYINANYIDGYRKQNAYIATQGPLPETFGDFWRMVWEQRSATIVMMTKLEEKSRVKCDQYWPGRGTETYGMIQVTLLDTIELATFCVRNFCLHKNGSSEKREVRQFQFTAWPDHGVPEYPTPFLAFLRRVKTCNPPDAGPVVVHCSAGVGRTGCFIVIDAMLERIKHEKTVDIYGHVTLMRSQRNYMVQTEDQYIFIHDALLEAVACGTTEVMARNLFSYIQKLTQVETGEHVTGMELEFKRLANSKAHTSRFISANLPCNKFKNRLVNIMPYETTRVCLQPIRGVEGSDYINASFIDGYRQQKAYIATQGPLAETTEDFWRMLWENNSTIVVMLTKLREMGREKCHQYWPAERSARYQYFVVDPMAEYNMPQYILREFKVTDARDGQSRTVRQFQFTDWPEQGVPKSGEGFIDFIGQVHKTKEQFGQDGPISVHCSAGVGRTGVFITLSIVLERMRYEGVVDIFQTVKMLRTQRPAMVQTEDEYQFCYQAALEYLGSFDHYAT